MPAKASLFNEKGDQLFDFGSGHKNMALYNPHGNILMIAGFGNLRCGFVGTFIYILMDLFYRDKTIGDKMM